MNPGCCWCTHYNPISWLERTFQRNVSGRKVWYRRWSKHRCSLKQEDKYPRDCDFEEDTEKIEKARKKDEEGMKNRSFTCSTL